MRFALRHKFQARNPDEELTLDKFVSNEDIVTLILNLSNYNRVGLSYTTSSTKWPPRGRLSGDAQPDGKNPLQGNTASPSHAIGFFFENNFTENLTLKGDFSVYKGFIWTFEDRDFVTMDGDAMRSWISISDRLSDRTSLYFKMRYDKGFTGSGLDVRKYNDPYGVPIESDHFRDENISYKFQMDVSW
jgi:hypothetical protein